MQCIMVKSDEFENSSPLYIFPLNPDYVAARSLRSPRSNKLATKIYDLATKIFPLVDSWLPNKKLISSPAGVKL